jgi:iron complex outermembrane receptor protein
MTPLPLFVLMSAALSMTSAGAFAQEAAGADVRIEVRSQGQPLQGAIVAVGALAVETDNTGRATLRLARGAVTVKVSAEHHAPLEKTLDVATTSGSVIVVELEPAVTEEEEVIVTATRSGRRVEEEPLRVEVLGRDEVEEKMIMTPGDISMLLNETSGLRVQVSSPSLGAANVRIQGLRGRYTQMLSDGLPLYGGQSGSISMLQIPPMDLGQVEIIKGVASALYGASALGGVVNLVSRQPGEESERELMLNQTTRLGSDAILWASGKWNERWSYTLIATGDRQSLRDIDADGWADLPSFKRGVARPRLFWNDGAGRSVFITVGGTAENREGGAIEGHGVFGGRPYVESLRTRRFDAGVSARLLWGSRLVSLKGSAVTQRHRHVFGGVRERDGHDTLFSEGAISGTSGRHAWVAGGAIQVEKYRSQDVPVFDYAHTTPGFFAQDEFALSQQVTLAASARIDHHNVYGTFVNPRVSLLARPSGWTIRASAGTGSFAPTPFVEETEAIGLSRLAPLGSSLRPERALGASLDIGRTFGAWEANLTGFSSVLRRPIGLQANGPRLTLINATEPTRNTGAEALLRWKRAPFTLTSTYTLTHSSEMPPGESRLESPLTPRHAAGLVGAFEKEGRGRLGIELYYVGRQRLEDNPFRDRTRPYIIVGAIGERRFGRVRVFINAENLTDSRQTRWEPLVRPSPGIDGRRTVDAWTPLEGRIFNGGIRLEF